MNTALIVFVIGFGLAVWSIIGMLLLGIDPERPKSIRQILILLLVYGPFFFTIAYFCVGLEYLSNYLRKIYNEE